MVAKILADVMVVEAFIGRLPDVAARCYVLSLAWMYGKWLCSSLAAVALSFWIVHTDTDA